VSLDKLVLSGGDWCLQISIKVAWFLPGFLMVGIGVSNRLVPTNNYKDYFCGFLLKRFP
jgi:hypothetical protein